MSDIAPINEKDVSLFRLKSELVELMQLTNEELPIEEALAVNAQIKAYVAAELRKVDNIRAYLRHCDVMADAAQEEANRLSELGRVWTRRRDRLKDLCRDLMIEFGEKKLEGSHGSITLKGNGGVQPLEIPQPAMVPDELCDWIGRIEGPAWLEIQKCCDNENWQVEADPEVRMERQPNNNRIREALKQGPVAGASLAERGSHVRVR